jgi:hypothetical protein
MGANHKYWLKHKPSWSTLLFRTGMPKVYMAFYGQRKGKRSQQGLGEILYDRFKKKKMNELFLIIIAGLCVLAIVLPYFDR